MTAVTLVLGLGVGAWVGPVKTFGMIGIMQTLGLIIVYCMGNLGVMLYFARKRRSEFKLWLHVLVPLATSVALIWVFWKNVETLHPFSPRNAFDYSPLLVIIWTVVGIAILAYTKSTGKEDWVLRAGKSVELRAETRDELLHRPAL